MTKNNILLLVRKSLKDEVNETYALFLESDVRSSNPMESFVSLRMTVSVTQR